MTEPRSWLFVPADSEKKIAKALDSDADAIIFDLEDSVAPATEGGRARDSEGPARALRRPAMVGAHQPARQRASSRTDLGLFGVADFHGVVLPKAESGADVAQLAHRTGNMPVHAIVTETAGKPVRHALLPRPEVAAGGDELGRGGSVGGAWRILQI